MPRNKFKKGYTPWNKGKKITFSKEHREAISKAKTGGKRRPMTLEERKRKSLSSIGKYKGERHHFWKGGISGLADMIRHSFKYRQWRSDCFQRDNYTCQICGIRSGNGKRVELNTDHIKQLSLILRENNIKSLEQAEGCQELWNINNGRTLCVECHRKTDNFGVKSHKFLKKII